MAIDSAVQIQIEQLYQDSWAKLLATLVRRTRDLDMAEDALQEAIERAIASWSQSGIPENPAGWVSTTAQRIALDAARRNTVLQRKIPRLVIPDEPDHHLHAADIAFRDDRLRLIFTCCHPVLSPESRLALTLRMICGLSTGDIAHLFLVQESTMAARITRAKAKLGASGVSYHIPSPQNLESRLQDVLSVIYLVATAGHTQGSGEGLHNTDHMHLAIKLAEIMDELVPHHPEVMGLRALVLLAEARKDSRIDTAGNALPLEQMDRSLWDTDLIQQARHLTEESLRKSNPETVGSYPLQAAIAMVHAEAPSWEETDWNQIVALYAVLDRRHPGAVVRLGYAVAVGMCTNPQDGLHLIEQSALDEPLRNYPMLPAARAFLYRRAGQFDQAIEHYRNAAKLTANSTLAAWFMEQIRILEED